MAEQTTNSDAGERRDDIAASAGADAGDSALRETVEKLSQRLQANDDYVKRIQTELGELRKIAKKPEGSTATETTQPAATTREAARTADAEPDEATKEAQRMLLDLKITMPEDQKQMVQEALGAADPEIIEIVKTDPRSRLVFMKKVLGEQFSLPKPKVDIFDGIGPAPERKPLHEQLQELLNKQNNPSVKPSPGRTGPRTFHDSQQDEPAEPSAKRYRSALSGGISGFRAATGDNQ